MTRIPPLVRPHTGKIGLIYRGLPLTTHERLPPCMRESRIIKGRCQNNDVASCLFLVEA